MKLRTVLLTVVAGVVTALPAVSSQASASTSPVPAPIGTPVNQTGKVVCLPPADWNKPGYDYINTYKSACASTKNWDRTFQDVTIGTEVDGRNDFRLTASTALAGATASVKVNDKEFIASGGHGQAQQSLFHAWDGTKGPSECYNPTQSGSARDDDGQRAPFHGPSTSALYEQKRDSLTTLTTRSRLAMYVPRSSNKPGYGGCWPTSLQRNASPFTQGLSPYWLRTKVVIGTGSNTKGLQNVIRNDVTLTSEDRRHSGFDGIFVSYLQRDFTDVYQYDPATKQLRKVAGTIASATPLVRCTKDRAYCLALRFAKGDVPSGSYYYAMTNEPDSYNGYSGEYTVQVTSPSKNVGVGGTTTIRYRTYVAVGNLERVRATLAKLGS